MGYGGKGPCVQQDYGYYYYPQSFKSNDWDALPPTLICPIKECQALHSNPKQKKCRFCYHSPLTVINPMDEQCEENTNDKIKDKGDKGKGNAKGAATTSPTTSKPEGEPQQAQAGQAAGKAMAFSMNQTRFVLTQPLLKSHMEIKHYLVASGFSANLDPGEDPILPSQAVLDPAKVEALKELSVDLEKAKERGQTNIARAIEEEIKSVKASSKYTKQPVIDAIYLDQVTLAKTKSAQWLNDSAEAAKVAIKQQAAALMTRFREIEAQQELANSQYAALMANVTLAQQSIKATPQAAAPPLTAGDISNHLLRRKEGFVSELSHKENIVKAVSELDFNPHLAKLGPEALMEMKAKMHEVFTMGIHGTLAQTVTLIGSGFFEPSNAQDSLPEAATIPVDEDGQDGFNMEEDFPSDWDTFAQP